jgi:ribosomal-protein-alanine N-acetyltransferase
MTSIVSRLLPTTRPTFLAARPRDAAAIAYLHAASFGRGWDEDEVLRLLLDSTVVAHRAMVRRTTVGFIM